MRLYIFKSESRPALRAFAADVVGSKLPRTHGPWTAVGIVGPSNDPPHRLSRAAIESAIEADGFQLWRTIEKAQAGREPDM